MSDSPSNKRIAKNTLFLYGRMAFALVVSLYTSRVVINTLGVVDFGINNVVAGFVSMFAFLNASLTASIQRFYNYENGRNGINGVVRVFNVSILSQTLLAVFVLLLVESVGMWYLANKMVIPIDRLDAAYFLFHITVVSMLLLIMQVPYSAAVMAYERMDFYAIVGVLDTVLRLLIVIALPFFPYDKLIVFGFLGLSISAFEYLMYYGYVKKYFKHLRFNFHIDLDMLKSIFAFSGWNMFGAFSIMLRGQGLNMLINLFFGPAVNAARGVAYSIQSALMGFIQNITVAARPQLTEAYAQGDCNRSVSLMYGISKLCFVLLYMMALPLVGEVHYILHLWLGDTVPEHTEAFVLLVLSISLVDVLNTPTSIMMLATGNIKRFNVTASIVGLFAIPLCYCWLAIGGSPNTVFYVGLIISIAVQIACVLIMCREIKVSAKDYLLKVVKPLSILVFLTAIVPLLCKLSMDESFARFCLTGSASVLSILMVAYYLVLTKNERSLCTAFIKNKFSKS